VPEEIIAEHGAVSPETASAMAKGIRKSTGADIGLGITGIAGPGGGTPDKPVGLVYIAVDGSHGTIVKKNIFAGQRDGIRQRSSLTALNEIRKYVLQPE
jgi:PncC family amidohydrolase